MIKNVKPVNFNADTKIRKIVIKPVEEKKEVKNIIKNEDHNATETNITFEEKTDHLDLSFEEKKEDAIIINSVDTEHIETPKKYLSALDLIKLKHQS
jgi:hypothetical protein